MISVWIRLVINSSHPKNIEFSHLHSYRFDLLRKFVCPCLPFDPFVGMLKSFTDRLLD
jgi:hypothetical protein